MVHRPIRPVIKWLNLQKIKIKKSQPHPGWLSSIPLVVDLVIGELGVLPIKVDEVAFRIVPDGLEGGRMLDSLGIDLVIAATCGPGHGGISAITFGQAPGLGRKAYHLVSLVKGINPASGLALIVNPCFHFIVRNFAPFNQTIEKAGRDEEGFC